MTDIEVPPASESTNTKPRSKGGIPRINLATTETYAKAIWNVSRRGEALPTAVARMISGKDDTKAAGGAWRTKPTALRVYSLIVRLNNDNLKLSDVGLALVNESDPEGQKRARRQAVLSVTAYLRILTEHNGNPLPSESTIATTFEFQYEVPTAAAKGAASVFFESVKYAGLLDADGNVNIDPSEAPAEQKPETSTLPKPPKAPKPEQHAPAQGGGAPAAEVPATPNTPPAPTTLTPPSPANPGPNAPVGVNVTIDMSKWEAKDVLSVLNVLGYGDKPSGD